MNVTICGGGVIGSAIAYALSRRAVDVKLIERWHVGGAASGKSGGFLARDWCDGTPAAALARTSFDLHEDWAERLGNPYGYRRLATFSATLDLRRPHSSPKKPTVITWLAEDVADRRQLCAGPVRIGADLGMLPSLAPGDAVLLVIDRTAVQAAGLDSELRRVLEDVPVTTFDQFSPNPTAQQAGAAAQAAADARAGAVIAIGGGSSLDVGKLAALAARMPHPADAFIGPADFAPADPLPVIAVPTTSGSGAEATHFAAVYRDGRKLSVSHERMRPRAVILDLRFHCAMPARLAAVTGLDALAQAMESLWAVGSTPESIELAECAGHLAAGNMERSVHAADQGARIAMMVAAHLAGRAINLSKTTAAHALSYQLTQRFGVPHGLAVALTVGHIGAANGDVTPESCGDPRGVTHVQACVQRAAAMLNVQSAGLPGAVGGLLRALDLPDSLTAVGIPAAAIASLAAGVDATRLGNNPRRFAAENLRAILQAAAVPSGEF